MGTSRITCQPASRYFEVSSIGEVIPLIDALIGRAVLSTSKVLTIVSIGIMQCVGFHVRRRQHQGVSGPPALDVDPAASRDRPDLRGPRLQSANYRYANRTPQAGALFPRSVQPTVSLSAADCTISGDTRHSRARY